MEKINTIWGYIGRHKYLITILLGLIIVGVLNENSLRKYAIQNMRINELNAEIEQYQEQFERDSARLNALINTPKGIEKVARERYLMKRDNEDIFIMSTDKKIENN